MRDGYSVVNGEAVFPEGITEIEDDAFEFCVELEKVVIPEGVEGIGRCAFCVCVIILKLLLSQKVLNLSEN